MCTEGIKYARIGGNSHGHSGSISHAHSSRISYILILEATSILFVGCTMHRENVRVCVCV